MSQVAQGASTSISLTDWLSPRLARACAATSAALPLVFLGAVLGRDTQRVLLLTTLLCAGVACALVPTERRLLRASLAGLGAAAGGILFSVFVLNYLGAVLDGELFKRSVSEILLAEAPQHLQESAPELCVSFAIAICIPWICWRRMAWFALYGLALCACANAFDPPQGVLDVVRNPASIGALVIPPLACYLDQAILLWLSQAAEAKIMDGDLEGGAASATSLAEAYPEAGLPQLLLAFVEADSGRLAGAFNAAESSLELDLSPGAQAIARCLLAAIHVLKGEVEGAAKILQGNPTGELFLAAGKRLPVTDYLPVLLEAFPAWFLAWLPWEPSEEGAAPGIVDREAEFFSRIWGVPNEEALLASLEAPRSMLELIGEVEVWALLGTLAGKRGDVDRERACYEACLEIPARPSLYSAYAKLRLDALPATG